MDVDILVDDDQQIRLRLQDVGDGVRDANLCNAEIDDLELRKKLQNVFDDAGVQQRDGLQGQQFQRILLGWVLEPLLREKRDAENK